MWIIGTPSLIRPKFVNQSLKSISKGHCFKAAKQQTIDIKYLSFHMNSRSLNRHTPKWKKKDQLILPAFRQLLKASLANPSNQVKFKQSPSQHSSKVGKNISNFGTLACRSHYKACWYPRFFHLKD